MTITMKPSVPEPSRLLQLPAELRIKVYKYLLISDVGQKVPTYKPNKTPNFARRSDTAVLATCRRIHGEALPVFYENNTFVFTLVPRSSSRRDYDIDFLASHSLFRARKMGLLPCIRTPSDRTHPRFGMAALCAASH